MEIYRLNALSDNYIFLLFDPNSRSAAAVDPAEAAPVLKHLQQLEATLVAIFNTHHHSDHVGGNQHLLAHYPHAVVCGGAEDRGRIPGQTRFLKANDSVRFANRWAQIMFVPGHTRAHIAYYFPPEEAASEDKTGWGELFCGDTLFAGGCGRLFEGTPTQMVNSLSQIRALPNMTRIWCAHEYTLKNLQFALTVDPENLDLQRRIQSVEAARRAHEATVPSSLIEEKRTNPFLRWDMPALQKSVQSDKPVQTFARLRGRKDKF